MRSISILGATGSIGMQAIDIVRKHPDKYKVVALTAGNKAEELYQLVREFKPLMACLKEEPLKLPEDMRSFHWEFGVNAINAAASLPEADDVLVAVVGIAGLPAVLSGITHKKRILLANKEALVTGGALVMDKARALGVEILPVDSEHSAIFQCLQGAGNNAPDRLILTASGGAFRDWDMNQLKNATAEDALRHPVWTMGKKITIDCATMMNKGLEVIEASWLFHMPPNKIEVLIHPQSIIHSMVEFSDGAILAQLGVPDMRGPISYAMAYPERIKWGSEKLDLTKIASLTFKKPDLTRFRCLQLAYDALKAGGNMPVTLNGANEVVVEAFLNGAIKFGAISEIVEKVLDATKYETVSSTLDIDESDAQARLRAKNFIKEL